MSKLSAFIGHSFLEGDKDVVEPILDYLNQIQHMSIGFSWVHAKPAEPKILSEKVLSLIEDKNLFIGICTKKERAVEDQKLKTSLFYKNRKWAEHTDFEWKTSDWIIQEIGLAFGRGMKVILLVEEGLRAPGGFQGSLEYIQLNRQSPEKSFGKILEMIQALLPNAKTLKGASAELPETSETEDLGGKVDEWLEPKPEWDQSNYEFALMRMIITENEKGEEKIYDAYLDTVEGKIEGKADGWAAAKEYMHILFAEDGSLEKIESLVKEKPENGEVRHYLAKAYQNYGEEVRAAEAYIEAASIESNEKKILLRKGDAALAYAKANKSEKLDKLIIEMRKNAISIENGESLLLEILSKIADIQKNKTAYLAYTERLLDLKPDDNKTRFSLAYGHSEQDREKLALFHYSKIPFYSRDPLVWNNMGVAYTRLGLPGKAIEAYRIAEDSDQTLAMDNIARKYLDAGFYSEAEQQCESAKKRDNYNKNIDDTLYKLKNKREEEEKKIKELLEEVKPDHEFYVEYGQALIQEKISDMTGEWKSPRCELTLEIKNNSFKAYGEYDLPKNALLGALGGIQPSTTEASKRIEIYVGEVVGHAIKGTYSNSDAKKSRHAKTILSKDDDSKEILMVMSKDLSSIKIFQENATYEFQRYHELEKID